MELRSRGGGGGGGEEGGGGGGGGGGLLMTSGWWDHVEVHCFHKGAWSIPGVERPV